MAQGDAAGHGDVPRREARVVVADDGAIFRRALVRQLEVLGMETVGLGTPEELESCLDANPPDAVLLDWHFGGGTAQAVLELLRARWIPTIILTGDPEGVEVTGVPVLGKPVELHLLRRQLAEVLARDGCESEESAHEPADAVRRPTV